MTKSTTNAPTSLVSPLSTEIWNIWLREYGARGAISLALSHGYTREEIRRANNAAALPTPEGR